MFFLHWGGSGSIEFGNEITGKLGSALSCMVKGEEPFGACSVAGRWCMVSRMVLWIVGLFV